MKTTNAFKCLIIAAVLLFAQNLNAHDTTKKADAPLLISGQVDAYYRASSNKVNVSKTSYTSQEGNATIGMANIALTKDNGKIGFVADLMLGSRADETNYPYTGSPAFIKQLFVTYKPTQKLKFTAP